MTLHSRAARATYASCVWTPLVDVLDVDMSVTHVTHTMLEEYENPNCQKVSIFSHNLKTVIHFLLELLCFAVVVNATSTVW